MIQLLTTSNNNKLKSSRLPVWLQSKRLRIQEEMIVQIKELQITSANYLKRLQEGAESDVNEYDSHSLQTNAIIDKYQGKAVYGSTLIKRLVNVAAALQVPNGIELDGDSNTPEYEYLKSFLDINQLNEGVAIQLAKQAQFEGQVLVELLWDGADDVNMVKLNLIPWSTGEYTVRPIGLNNLTGPYEAKWSVDGEVVRTLIGKQLAFIAFNVTRESDYIEGWPTLGGLLMRIDAVSRDLRDWRLSNKLYAHPTPVFTCDTQAEVDSLTNKITSSGWQVGTAIAFKGKFLLTVAANYHQTISNAIETNMKLISGGSGVAISWLGFADVMSNRATAESLGEPLEIVSAADIATWRSFYEEMFDNVIEIRNESLNSQQKLKKGKIKPRLKPMSDRQWKRITDLFMPAAEKGLLTKESFLEQIPNFDVKLELERLEKELAEAEPEVDLEEVEDFELEEE